jgi:outer membrane protein assembly factor BamB
MRGRSVASLVSRVIGPVAVLAALAVGAILVVPGSDAATADISVAAVALPPLPSGPLPASGAVRWSAPSLPAGGPAVDGGTVVVAAGGRISGRDPLTGAERWSYERGNATLCAWTVQDGAVVAAYGKGHGCTDLLALDAGTGARRWYRNADLGPGATLTSTRGVAVARSGDQLIAVDTVTGLNRWAARRPGCQYGPLLVNTLGAVVVLTCPGRTLLVDHDAYADTEHWAVDVPGTDPSVVDVGDPTTLLSVVGGRPTLTMYDGRGKAQGSIVDARFALGRGGPPAGVSAGGTTVVWTGTAVVGVNTRSRVVTWSAPALGPPTLEGENVLVSQPDGFTQLAVSSGAVLHRMRLPGSRPDPDTAPARVGILVATSGPGAVTVYG